jgi:hypothetical protein
MITSLQTFHSRRRRFTVGVRNAFALERKLEKKMLQFTQCIKKKSILTWCGGFCAVPV